VFRISGRITAAANEGAKSFRIATGTIAPELLVRDAALDETACLKAAFKQTEEAPLLPAASRAIVTASSSVAARWR